ncbi:hypothetical protein QP027_01745 [Corynebacterium breve]|uniref:DUF304 domain-containing protein n=1 Tax=Corynebacterium breve TaxID=3049799 RepID=A0ABY8VGB4_9CORY|nr:hypothetical protein [Corynebacterium breve]WIM68147.1 hypothetical protein QP027_01745 [Corynebacterium breve]
MEPVVFQQRLNGSIRTFILVLGALSLLGAAVSWMFQRNLLELVIYLAAAAFFFLCLLIKVTMTVHEAGIDLTMLGGIADVHLPASSIKGVTLGPTTGLKEGAGIRFIGNAEGLIVGGPTIKIERTTAPYLVSMANPDEAIAAINRCF